MDTTILIESVENTVDDTWRCYVGKTKWGKTTLNARTDLTITDADSNVHTITDFEHDSWLEVVSLTEPPLGLWTLPKLRFMPGTPKAFLSEATKQRFSTQENTMPVIWLMEIMQERVSYKTTSDNYIIPIARMFFLDDADFANWTKVEHLEQGVRPMRNYADRMIKSMMYSDKFGDPVGEPVFVNQTRFGLSFNQPKTQDNFSHQTNLFNEKTSGVELRLEIPVRRKCYD
jgi:hypothetical protein